MYYILEVVFFDVLEHKSGEWGLPVEASVENIPHPSFAERHLQFCCFVWFPHTHPLEVSMISHRADGMLAGVAPALQSSASLELLQYLVVQTNLSHQFLATCSYLASPANISPCTMHQSSQAS